MLHWRAASAFTTRCRVRFMDPLALLENRESGTKWHSSAISSRPGRFPQFADDDVHLQESELHKVAQNGTK